MIQYSAAFVERVKKAFPNNNGLHAALDSGSPEVGDLLGSAVRDVLDLPKLWSKEMMTHLDRTPAKSAAL